MSGLEHPRWVITRDLLRDGLVTDIAPEAGRVYEAITSGDGWRVCHVLGRPPVRQWHAARASYAESLARLVAMHNARAAEIEAWIAGILVSVGLLDSPAELRALSDERKRAIAARCDLTEQRTEEGGEVVTLSRLFIDGTLVGVMRQVVRLDGAGAEVN